MSQQSQLGGANPRCWRMPTAQYVAEQAGVSWLLLADHERNAVVVAICNGCI